MIFSSPTGEERQCVVDQLHFLISVGYPEISGKTEFGKDLEKG
jgi:hypothetical protein